MIKLLPLLAISLLFSCGETSNSESDARADFDFSYTIDTVMVDPGEGFLYLKRQLDAASISPDKKTLYNYNGESGELEVIDFEKLHLKERIQMEKEGPLGTGNPMAVSISEAGNFFFINFFDIRSFNPALDSMSMFRIRRDQFEGLESDETLNTGFIVSDDGKQLFVPYGPEDGALPQRGIGILSLKDKSLKKIPLEIYSRLQPYVTTLFQDGKMQMQTIEPVYFYQVGQRLLISSQNFNDAYILNLETDSISHEVYQSAITKNSKKIPEKTTLDSQEEMRANFTAMNEQVNFGKFYFDEKEKRFWRVSRDLDRMIGDSATFKQVITVFDEKLNQLHEAQVPINFFSYKFFKDGKLYSYVNVEDEMGFEVYTFKLD
jgi:hypothetical protein